jgi:hypothetical protein
VDQDSGHALVALLTIRDAEALQHSRRREHQHCERARHAIRCYANGSWIRSVMLESPEIVANG